jgi:hypothetical protein
MRFFSLSGLCSIFRSEAGGQADRFDSAEAAADQDLNYRNNAHWLNNGEPSNFVAYYDATSLYPSSGEFVKAKRGGGGGRERKRKSQPAQSTFPPHPKTFPLPFPSPTLPRGAAFFFLASI